jgi:hypothetical protein
VLATSAQTIHFASLHHCALHTAHGNLIHQRYGGTPRSASCRPTLYDAWLRLDAGTHIVRLGSHVTWIRGLRNDFGGGEGRCRVRDPCPDVNHGAGSCKEEESCETRAHRNNLGRKESNDGGHVDVAFCRRGVVIGVVGMAFEMVEFDVVISFVQISRL